MCPDWVPTPKPRHVSWLGIESLNFLLCRLMPDWATPVRAPYRLFLLFTLYSAISLVSIFRYYVLISHWGRWGHKSPLPPPQSPALTNQHTISCLPLFFYSKSYGNLITPISLPLLGLCKCCSWAIVGYNYFPFPAQLFGFPEFNISFACFLCSWH